jgi:hypothetical protein
MMYKIFNNLYSRALANLKGSRQRPRGLVGQVSTLDLMEHEEVKDAGGKADDTGGTC